MTILTTERLKLRHWQKDDRAPFARMNADHLIMEYFPRKLDEKASNNLVDRFQKHIDTFGFGPYALEVAATGEFIGFVGLHKVELKVPFAPAVEIAWRLDYGAWGKGYATEAAHAVIRQGFEDKGLKEIVAFAVHDNSRALHIMEKLGMARDAKGDFDYPGLKKDHPLGRFVLYRLAKKAYQKAAA